MQVLNHIRVPPTRSLPYTLGVYLCQLVLTSAIRGLGSWQDLCGLKVRLRSTKLLALTRIDYFVLMKILIGHFSIVNLVT